MDGTSGQYNYVVTAQKPTSVTHSVVGNFTHEDELNLVVAKCTRVEIHLLTPQGLQAMMDVPIYGRIATMELVRPPFEKKPMLFILTERNMFCVLSYDAAKGELITRAMGDLTDRVGRPSECGPIGAVDPECRMYGLHLYDGLFKVIPMDQTGQLREAFSVRLEELQVFDVKFLAGTPKPTIAVLYQDTKEGRHIKTYEVCLKDKDFNPGPWAQNDVESGSRFLIAVPAPLGGVVVVGEKVIAYLNKETTHGVGDGGGGGGGGGGGMIVKAIAMQSDATIMTYGAVDKDGSRYLLSDSAGRLHLLVLMHDKTRVRALKLESLGQTSIASSLSYLDNGVVYVGSAYGDSQLVRLHSTPIPIAGGGGGDGDGGGGGGGEIVPVDSGAVTDAPNYVEVLESFTSLGPIVDFVVVDLDRHGQGQVVTCSGVHKDGSLRVVRNGVGIHEQAAIELPGVKGCWALKNADDAVSDTFLVVAFIGETRILAINDEDELDETEFEGFAGDERALACANVDGGYACQVTSGGIRLVDVATGALRARWTPEPGERVSVAAANRTQVVVALEGGTLVSVAAGGGGDAMDVDDASPLLRELARVNVGHEIACLDVTPLADPRAASSEICAVGLWSAEVRVLATATLEELSSAPLTDAEVIPRAVLLCSFEGIPYLLAGLGDGQLFTFALMGERSGIIGDGKKLSVGTQARSIHWFPYDRVGVVNADP
jgi:DNA damage-binding protein 1